MSSINVKEKMMEFIENTKKASDAVHYFLTGCSTREKKEYTNALKNIKEIMKNLNSYVSLFENTPFEIESFSKNYEANIISILNKGREYLQNALSLEEFMSQTETMTNEMDSLKDSFTAKSLSELESYQPPTAPIPRIETPPVEEETTTQTKPRGESKSGRRLLDQRKSTINDVENIMKLSQLLLNEENKTENIKEQLKQAVEQIDKLKERVKTLEGQIEEKNSLLIDIQVQFQGLIREQKESISSIRSYIEQIDKLNAKLINFKSKLEGNQNLEELRELKKMIANLTVENSTLREKISAIEVETQKSMKKTNELKEAISFDIRKGNVTDETGHLKREVEILLKQQLAMDSQVNDLKERERELSELALRLDETLKKNIEEFKSVKTVPKEFLGEFQKFQEEVYGIWDKIHEVITTEEAPLS